MEENEHATFDYDRLIAESTGLSRQWWELWKRIHPKEALRPEKESVIQLPPKSKVTFKLLTCKRCNSTWTPRRKEPPVQCPKCLSPSWKRERVNK
jgi:rubrerythrin